MDNRNPFYREIVARITVTTAEATIAWFCSGVKQELIVTTVKFPVYAADMYDCTQALQRAIDTSSVVFLPSGTYYTLART